MFGTEVENSAIGVVKGSIFRYESFTHASSEVELAYLNREKISTGAVYVRVRVEEESDYFLFLNFSAPRPIREAAMGPMVPIIDSGTTKNLPQEKSSRMQHRQHRLSQSNPRPISSTLYLPVAIVFASSFPRSFFHSSFGKLWSSVSPEFMSLRGERPYF